VSPPRQGTFNVPKFANVCAELIVDAGHYWERMRIPYNLVLATLSLVCWGGQIFTGRLGDLVAGIVVLTVFGIAANLCFCAAYPVDLALQLLPLRRYRSYARGALFASGLLVASACATYVLLGDHMA